MTTSKPDPRSRNKITDFSLKGKHPRHHLLRSTISTLPAVTPTKTPHPQGRNRSTKRVCINAEANIADQDPPFLPSSALHSDMKQERPETLLAIATKHLETSLASLDNHVRLFVQDFSLGALTKYVLNLLLQGEESLANEKTRRSTSPRSASSNIPSSSWRR